MDVSCFPSYIKAVDFSVRSDTPHIWRRRLFLAPFSANWIYQYVGIYDRVYWLTSLCDEIQFSSNLHNGSATDSGKSAISESFRSVGYAGKRIRYYACIGRCQ
jgi:hypothetical protein